MAAAAVFNIVTLFDVALLVFLSNFDVWGSE